MHLLYPIGLFALAGIIIPVLIHLWHIKRGKTLKIGSILFMGESARSSARSWHIKHWPLFILRCLLLLLMALLLAQPHYESSGKNTGKHGWLLIDQTQLARIYKTNERKIDSLLAQGFELHAFNQGFETITLKDSLTNANPEKAVNYPALLRQLNQLLPARLEVHLFANRSLVNFDGNLPAVNYNLHWHIPAQRDTLSTWQSEWMGKVYKASSYPALTIYRPAPQSIPVAPDTVLIYPADGADTRYLKAAVAAISHYSGRPLVIKAWSEKALADSMAVAGFWLSGQDINDTYLAKLKRGGNVLTYARGKSAKLNSTILLHPGTTANEEAIALYQKINAKTLQGEKIWTDGYGNIILGKTKHGELNEYQFYSRFNPQWTNLVWDSRFVKAMLPLVLGAENENLGFGFEDQRLDRREYAAEQKSFINQISSKQVAQSPVSKPLNKVFWLAMFLILIFERFLSFKLTNNRNGNKG